MAWIPDRYRELRALVRGERVDDDVAEEFAHHLAMRVEELTAAGMSPETARAAALGRFGDVARYREQTRHIAAGARRERRLAERLGDLRRDARLAARSLARTPSFSVIAVLTLALGVGATTAVFAILDRVVLRPLPYPGAERLVWVEHRAPGYGMEKPWGLSAAGYFYFREHNRSFEDVGAMAGAFGTPMVNVAGGGAAERVRAAAVTASLLHVLGARPALGRLILPDDDRPGAAPVVVLGYGFWQRRYGGDPSVVGRTIELEGSAARVVGVLERGFDLPGATTGVWVPLALDPAARPQNSHQFSGVARLRPGVTATAAQADLDRMMRRFPELFPSAYSEGFMREAHFSVHVLPLRDHVVGGVARVLWILLASVALVLLIACANVANLFLVRAEGRRRELAVRTALGASRAHLAWQFATEGALLALASAPVAAWMAHAAVRVLPRLVPTGLPRVAELRLGWEGAAVAAALALVAGVALGLLPLVRRPESPGVLRDGSRGLTPSRAQRRVRGTLVVGQVALAVVLLAAAGLMLQSVRRLRSVDAGFRPAGVLTVDVALPEAKYATRDAANAFYGELLRRVAALPGVARAGAVETGALPLTSDGGCSAVFGEGATPDERGPGACVPTATVAPGYFATMGIRLRGRAPTWEENDGRSAGVVVSRALAERFWPGEDPIGKGITGNQRKPPYYRVVGVTDDVRTLGLDRPATEVVYFPLQTIPGSPLWGEAPRAMTLVLRAPDVSTAALVDAVRRAVAELDASVPVAAVRTMEQVVADSPSVARVTFAMLLLGVASAMALLLSAVGLYGAVSYLVGQRRGEIGVRMALGARVAQVARLVVMQSVRLAAAGVLLGLAGAIAILRVLRSLLFEVSPTDPLTLAAVAALLVVTAAAASYAPARRAARVDPAEALRAE